MIKKSRNKKAAVQRICRLREGGRKARERTVATVLALLARIIAPRAGHSHIKYDTHKQCDDTHNDKNEETYSTGKGIVELRSHRGDDSAVKQYSKNESGQSAGHHLGTARRKELLHNFCHPGLSYEGFGGKITLADNPRIFRPNIQYLKP